MINGIENEAEKEKIDHIDTAQVDLDLNMDTKIL